MRVTATANNSRTPPCSITASWTVQRGIFPEKHTVSIAAHEAREGRPQPVDGREPAGGSGGQMGAVAMRSQRAAVSSSEGKNDSMRSS